MWREEIINFMNKNRKPEWRYAHSYRIYHLAKELDVEKRCDDDILFTVAMLKLSKTLPNRAVTEKTRAIDKERQKEMEDFIEKLRKETFAGEYM